MHQIALLLDADLCSETLYQAQALAQALNRTEDMRARIIIFGPILPESALNNSQDQPESYWNNPAKPTKVFHLPRPRGLTLLDAISLIRSKALANCGLLHCFSLSLLKTLSNLSTRKSLPPCCVSLSHWPEEAVVRQLRRLAKTSSARIICHSHALQQNLINADIPDQHCPIVEPGIASQHEMPTKSLARKELGISDGIELLLTDPEVSCSSNHRQTTWAAAIMGQFNPKLRVLVSDSDARVKRLRQFDDSLNPPSLGIYPGQNIAPELLYAAADLLVLPATNPVSPLPLFRAAQAHLPVVASNNRAFRDYLKHEHNALLFAPGIHNAGDPTCRRIRPLATAVERILQDQPLAQRLANQLAQDLANKHTEHQTISANLKIYQQLLATDETPIPS